MNTGIQQWLLSPVYLTMDGDLAVQYLQLSEYFNYSRMFTLSDQLVTITRYIIGSADLSFVRLWQRKGFKLLRFIDRLCNQRCSFEF